jgi:hypothetical protein
MSPRGFRLIVAPTVILFCALAGIAPTYNTIVRPPEGHLTGEWTDGRTEGCHAFTVAVDDSTRSPATDSRQEYRRTNAATVAVYREAVSIAETCRPTDHPKVRLLLVHCFGLRTTLCTNRLLISVRRSARLVYLFDLPVPQRALSFASAAMPQACSGSDQQIALRPGARAGERRGAAPQSAGCRERRWIADELREEKHLVTAASCVRDVGIRAN